MILNSWKIQMTRALWEFMRKIMRILYSQLEGLNPLKINVRNKKESSAFYLIFRKLLRCRVISYSGIRAPVFPYTPPTGMKRWREGLFDVVEEVEEGWRRRENEEFRREDCSCRDVRSSTRMRETRGSGETLDRGSGSGLSVQGDEEGPHPPRFIDRVTPLAGALANFPPYLRSPITLFLQRAFFPRCTERWSALRARVSAFPVRKRCRDICGVELEARWLRDKDDGKVYR